MRKILNFILVASFIFMGENIKVISQNRAYYEKLKSNKKASIEYSKKLLNNLKSDQESNFDKLLITREQIRKQKDILNIINKELTLIDQEILNDEKLVVDLGKEKDIIKEEYAKLIQFTYKTLDLQRKMIFIFSADNFNKAYKRMIYLKNLSDYRKSRFIKIEENIRESDSLLTNLKEKRNSKVSLQKEKLSMLDSLEIRQKGINLYLSQNKSEINKVVALIDNENKKQAVTKANVTKQIEKQEQDKPVKVSNKSSKLDGSLNSSFESKKGWLIWPLSKFVVLHHFGDYYHPVFENVQVKNDGVELGATPASNVHCVFDGNIVDIIQIPGDGASIIIKHGNYYSVYSKLGQVMVKSGETVTKGQVIAKMNKNEKLVKMNFQLWKGKEKLNPEVWLKRQ
jgi:murein hydrolase activator